MTNHIIGDIITYVINNISAFAMIFMAFSILVHAVATIAFQAGASSMRDYRAHNEAQPHTLRHPQHDAPQHPSPYIPPEFLDMMKFQQQQAATAAEQTKQTAENVTSAVFTLLQKQMHVPRRRRHNRSRQQNPRENVKGAETRVKQDDINRNNNQDNNNPDNNNNDNDNGNNNSTVNNTNPSHNQHETGEEQQQSDTHTSNGDSSRGGDRDGKHNGVDNTNKNNSTTTKALTTNNNNKQPTVYVVPEHVVMTGQKTTRNKYPSWRILLDNNTKPKTYKYVNNDTGMDQVHCPCGHQHESPFDDYAQLKGSVLITNSRNLPSFGAKGAGAGNN